MKIRYRISGSFDTTTNTTKTFGVEYSALEPLQINITALHRYPSSGYKRRRLQNPPGAVLGCERAAHYHFTALFLAGALTPQRSAMSAQRRSALAVARQRNNAQAGHNIVTGLEGPIGATIRGSRVPCQANESLQGCRFNRFSRDPIGSLSCAA